MTHENINGAAGHGIPMQDASLDIWDKKYRLKDKHGTPVDETIDDTYRRVAAALASQEEKEAARWEERFLWALRMGAIPAGRIMSNAGAGMHKPSTSLINCTVSGTLPDSMNGILSRAHEAGMTLKAGCGIGYEFSTLRPRGAFVAGAGSYTSGPLSFMDIFDKVCQTVSSAGGRRGAQMATFDVAHPDVLDFIRAKREDGRLRQFNLSLLITADFLKAVDADGPWDLSFPVMAAERDEVDLFDPKQVVWRAWPMDARENYIVREDGCVACRIYRTIRARHLWNQIMSSTYDFAEPGFIMIDHVNAMNNNWFCESIRATNPCVTGDTRLATQYGMVPIGELYASGAALQVTVDSRSLEHEDRGVETRSAKPAFMTAARAPVFRVTTEDGYSIKATEWHDFYTERGKLKLRDLKIGDGLLVQSGKGQFGRQGSGYLGLLLGLIAGDGHFTQDRNGQPMAAIGLWGEKRALAERVATFVNTLIAHAAVGDLRNYSVTPVAIPKRNCTSIRSVLLARVLEHYGFSASTKWRVPEVVWRGSEACVKNYLRALFQCDGTVNASGRGLSCSIRLSSSRPDLLKDVQMLLANLGVFCRIRKRRDACMRRFQDGRGGSREYPCLPDHELVIDGESREQFMREVGFLLPAKTQRYLDWRKGKVLRKTQAFASRIASIECIGEEPVFDTTQPDHNAVIFNGLVTGQCGEQPLPPHGSCLLGSVNLTSFVVHPFTADARFDWETYRKVVRVFTRMLDNVVELNGLPLQGQRDEILRKRRHGMGFMGLGSALVMLGMTYGDAHSVQFAGSVARDMAVTGWRAALSLALEKGPAPIMLESFEITPEMLALRPEMAMHGYRAGERVQGSVLHALYGRHMQRIAGIDEKLVGELAVTGARFTHHTSIAPTGTIALSLANNASNGIEPSFAHKYSRNVIREGRKTKEKIEVYSYELLAYRHLIDSRADPDHGTAPPCFNAGVADAIAPKAHVDVQAAVQAWVDSSISKTINVPQDFPFEDFRDVYRYAAEKGLKGCTTFRFNPDAFQGVLVKEADLANTEYEFVLEDGQVLRLKGNEEVQYDGETHTAANLFDALKEGYYGRL
jgi:ribonucleoside-diphosphate reductase alpha chain